MTADRKAAIAMAQSKLHINGAYDSLAAAFLEVTAELEQERKAHTHCPHCKPCRHHDTMLAYDDVLSGLASFVGAGGYGHNGFIDPKVADEKIRWGIDHIVSVETGRREAAEQRAAELQARLDRVEAALVKYGRHFPLCNIITRLGVGEPKCGCGFDATMRAIAAAGE